MEGARFSPALNRVNAYTTVLHEQQSRVFPQPTRQEALHSIRVLVRPTMAR